MKLLENYKNKAPNVNVLSQYKLLDGYNLH